MEDSAPDDPTERFAFQPIAIQRSKWLHQFHVWSPKLSRRLVLYSQQAIDFWAMIESHATILTFCEYPGFILVDEKPRIADFVLHRDGANEFVVLNATPLAAVDSGVRKLLDPLPITTVTAEALASHRQWIDNWLRMLPYITSNARFVAHELFDRVEQSLAAPKPLYAIEHDALPADPMLIRTAVFDLTRRGRLTSPDLHVDALSKHTRFKQAIAAEGTS
ncbi:hypothetical protein ACUTFY_23350 [Burkholderia pseudomallei]|uniref:hypothetical protein n=1 Tax=Burkholderia pseudomallei TaxID=28450 RepID=UPI00018A5718|nr:hypothetical protein [Burkholderia pseudomallei]AIO96595.1 hypothetical protein DP50_2222 [Burkholderia pseudomallei 576]EEC35245.1 conserved hypothetical protein [Burkholderia pseudomallei 576]KGD28364.1 hypothetical protein DP59_3110 [Burkholderia pseudomallei]